MIPLNEERCLGKKTYMLLVARKTMPAMVFLLLAMAALIAGNVIGGASPEGLSSVLSLTFFGALILCIILFVIGAVIARLQYSNYTFTMEEFDLKLKKGIFSQHEISIPYRNIQSVDVTRSLSYRMMGLSRLVIQSAGHEDAGENDEADTVFDPIDRELGDEIRLELERKIGVQVIESEKEADTENKNGPVLSGPML